MAEFGRSPAARAHAEVQRVQHDYAEAFLTDEAAEIRQATPDRSGRAI